jgi:hypothetical protein
MNMEKKENVVLNSLEIAKKQDEIVLSVVSEKALTGFQKAYLVSDAIGKLKELLNDEYMKPIVALQGTKLGFVTDKDKDGGYPIAVVRMCLIEAVLKGYKPYGNEFNIIAGNMYPTKEGLENKLNGWKGLRYSIISSIKSISSEKTSAMIESVVSWTIDGESNKEIIPIPLKINAYTSVDAMIGKAKRKACAWLLSNLTGESVTDGDVSEIPTTEDVIAEEISENANSEVIDFEEIPEPIETPKTESKKETAKDLFEEPTVSAIRPEIGF